MAYLLWLLLSTITLFISYLELISNYTKKMTPTCKTSCDRFYKFYKQYQNMHVIFKVFEPISLFFTVLIFVGAMLASVAGFAMIRLWNKLNIIIYLSTPSILVACFMVAVIMTKDANAPRANIVRFKVFWALHIRTTLERKQWKVCTQIGFVLGPYGLVTSKLGIYICDDITRNIVTLVLLYL